METQPQRNRRMFSTPISSPRDLRVGVQSSNKHFTNNYRPTDFCSCSVEDSNRRYAFDPFNHSTSWLVVGHAPLPKERFLKRVCCSQNLSFFLCLKTSNSLFYFPLADPLGTFLKRRLTDPHFGHDQSAGRSAQAFGPLVKT